MEWVTSIFTGGASAIFGGVLGTIGGIFTKWMDHKNKMEEMELESKERAADRAHDLACIAAETEKATKIANLQAEKEMDLARTNAAAQQMLAEFTTLNKAIDAEAAGATWSTAWASKLSGAWAGLAGMMMVIVDMVRGLTRPGLTLYLVILVTIMYNSMVQKATVLTAEQSFQVCNSIVNMALFLASSAVSFWFGSRGQGAK